MPMVVASPRMAELLSLVEQVARTQATVLVEGESGSGKELVARALHHFSARAGGPWVDVSCGALPELLMESLLFGHEKGAFPGAEDGRPGLFEMAQEGTLFLDEIGELDPRMQVKLLRILDGTPYYRLGGTAKIPADVRVLAATGYDLDRQVAEGRFRPDLFHRLAQVRITVPPLRERPEDIEALARYFLAAIDPSLEITPEGLLALAYFPWPGNVRELRNVMTRAALLARHGWVGAGELVLCGCTMASNDLPPGGVHLETIERDTILKALSESGGHRQRAAERLGISRRTLTRKLKQYRLEEDHVESVAHR
jgi:DNA-binding NtrC family response regulator